MFCFLGYIMNDWPTVKDDQRGLLYLATKKSYFQVRNDKPQEIYMSKKKIKSFTAHFQVFMSNLEHSTAEADL